MCFLLDWCSGGCTSRDEWVYSSDDSDWPPAGNRQDGIRASVKIPDRCQLLPSGCISTAIGDSVPLLQVRPLMISSVETVVFQLLVLFLCIYAHCLVFVFFWNCSVCPDLLSLAMVKKDFHLCQIAFQNFPDIPEAVTCACLKTILRWVLRLPAAEWHSDHFTLNNWATVTQ